MSITSMTVSAMALAVYLLSGLSLGSYHGVACDEFAFDQLIPKLATIDRPPVKLATPPNLTWYSSLSDEAKTRTRRYLGIDSPSDDAVLEFLSAFHGATISVTGSVIKIDVDNPYGEVPELSVIGRNVVGISLMYQQGRYVCIQPPRLRYAMYFFQINRTNLRQFTALDGKNLDDKSYRQLSEDLNGILDAEYCNRLLRVILEGFTEDVTRDLSLRQEELLCDVAGIYMAEAFRLIKRSARGKVVQRMPAALVLTLYFRSGGRMIGKSPRRPTPDTLPTSHFSSKHSDFLKMIGRYDLAITRHMEERHSWLVAQMREYLTHDGLLLDSLGRYCENPEGLNNHFRWLLERFLRTLEYEAAEMQPVEEPGEIEQSAAMLKAPARAHGRGASGSAGNWAESTPATKVEADTFCNSFSAHPRLWTLCEAFGRAKMSQGKNLPHAVVPRIPLTKP